MKLRAQNFALRLRFGLGRRSRTSDNRSHGDSVGSQSNHSYASAYPSHLKISHSCPRLHPIRHLEYDVFNVYSGQGLEESLSSRFVRA
jgi:hypothetical protein